MATTLNTEPKGIPKTIADYLMSPEIKNRCITSFPSVMSDPRFVIDAVNTNDRLVDTAYRLRYPEKNLEIICMKVFNGDYRVMVNGRVLYEPAHYYEDFNDDFILRQDTSKISMDVFICMKSTHAEIEEVVYDITE